MQPTEVTIPAYGEIYADENTTAITLASEGVFVAVTIFDVNGESLNTTPDHTNDNITVIIPGRYMMTCAIGSFSSQSDLYHFSVMNSGVPLDNLSMSRSTTVASKPGSTTLIGIVNLAAGDVIDLEVERRTGGGASKTITIEHVTLSIVRLSA